MKYIKRFNESSDSGIFEDIEHVIRICLEEYCSDYGMTIFIEDGFYTNDLWFTSKIDIETLNKLTGIDLTKSYEKCVKVTMINESIPRIRGSRLEIHLDENSQNLFDESIEMLKSQLNFITNDSKILQLPRKLKTTFWQIQFLIVYK
jgi:hypothetical protein